jgi:hypothetical protein
VIRGYFDRLRYERPVPRVQVDVSLPRISPFPAQVNFLIDSGATSSTLHPQDMLARFRLTPSELTAADRWPRQRTGFGIGGRVLDFVEPATVRFERDDGTVLGLDVEILIARLTPENEELPSLLGWDVLRHFRLTLDVRTGDVLLQE